MSLDEQDSDPLGALCARYCPWVYGLNWCGMAAVLAAVGGLVAANAAGISRRLTDGEGDPKLYVVLGCVFLGCGVVLAVVGLFRTGQSFEVHRGGVRYRSWFGKREMTWRETGEIFVNKVTHIQRGRGRRSYYTIRISSVSGCIFLGRGFLSSVSPIAVVQMLKLHSRRAVTGDCDDIRVPARMHEESDFRDADPRDPSGPPRRKKKRRPTPPAGIRTPFDEAADRLSAGEPGAEVEAWLHSQQIPAPAARAMVDKALAQRIVRDETPVDDELEELLRQARKQLDAGAKPERVERWLHEQGVSPNWVSAMMQNLREERL
jgi:hypothetical protein